MYPLNVYPLNEWVDIVVTGVQCTLSWADVLTGVLCDMGGVVYTSVHCDCGGVAFTGKLCDRYDVAFTGVLFDCGGGYS